ncbi:long-chain fatty acid--CoA ligase [Pseudonocardia sp. MCCB 268]|nr:long-chain fatty acid--CoA ligase [Pseudonocardia cytotoxica]
MFDAAALLEPDSRTYGSPSRAWSPTRSGSSAQLPGGSTGRTALPPHDDLRYMALSDTEISEFSAQVRRTAPINILGHVTRTGRSARGARRTCGTRRPVGLPRCRHRPRDLRRRGPGLGPEHPGRARSRGPAPTATTRTTRSRAANRDGRCTGDTMSVDELGYFSFSTGREGRRKVKAENVASAEVERVPRDPSGGRGRRGRGARTPGATGGCGLPQPVPGLSIDAGGRTEHCLRHLARFRFRTRSMSSTGSTHVDRQDPQERARDRRAGTPESRAAYPPSHHECGSVVHRVRSGGTRHTLRRVLRCADAERVPGGQPGPGGVGDVSSGLRTSQDRRS